MKKRDEKIELMIPDHERELKNICFGQYGAIFAALEQNKLAGMIVLRHIIGESAVYKMKMAMVRLLFTTRTGGESVECGMRDMDIKKELLCHALLFCRAQGIRYLLFTATSDDSAVMKIAHGMAFIPLPTMANLRYQADNLPKTSHQADVIVRPMRGEDIPLIEEIAATAFVYDRYNLDPFLPAPATAEIHREWARKCCNFCQLVLVAEKQNSPVGFCAVTYPNNFTSSAIVQLIAVNPLHQQHGIGKSLLHETLCQIQPHASEALVRTESPNLPAMSLYKSMGFKVYSTFQYMRRVF